MLFINQLWALINQQFKGEKKSESEDERLAKLMALNDYLLLVLKTHK